MQHRHSFQITIVVLTGCLVSALADDPEENTLTPQEKDEGWQLLFDGKDLNGWHSYLEKSAGKAWQVQNGMIVLNKNAKSVYKDYADLTSDDEFENFDFKVEWKMEPCSNAGVMFYVHESPEFKNT